MDVYNRKMPGGFFFHVEQFVLAATPFFAYRNLLCQLLKVVHTQNHRVNAYAGHFQVAIVLFFVLFVRIICSYYLFVLFVRIICSSYRQKTVYACRWL